MKSEAPRRRTNNRKKTTPKAPLAGNSDLASPGSRILAIDVGGSGLKAAVLDYDGQLLTERVRVETPSKGFPDSLIDDLCKLVEPFNGYEFVSVGFPGVVRHGKIVTAPNLGTKELKGVDLAGALGTRLGKPVRVINDADMQGLGAIKGTGVEMVITLGTGFGSALFVDGQLSAHLEISHSPFRQDQTYDEQLGDRARKKIGPKRWNRRVRKAIACLRVLTNFDHLYIGGGNASKIKFELDPDVEIVSNEFGVKGGAWLWRKRH